MQALLVAHAAALSLAPARALGGQRAPACRQRTVPSALASAELPLSAFNSWLEAKGVETGTVHAQRLPGFGLSLVARETGVKQGTNLLSVPASLHLSPQYVKETPVGQAVAGVINDESALLALGLLQEAARGHESSEYWPYLELLPSVSEMQIPLLWNEDERTRLFCGSHLETMVESVLAELRSQWALLEANVFPQSPEIFPPDTFNFQGFLWAQAIVLTRALPFGESLSLIPFLDFANHKAGASNTCSIAVRTDGGVQSVSELAELERLGGEAAAVITAGKDLAPGEQVFIDYGENGWRSSWEMLYTYGFVPGESEEWLATGGKTCPNMEEEAKPLRTIGEGRPLFFQGFSPNDPLRAQKQALLVALGVDASAADGIWVDLKGVSRTGGEMAPFLRLVYLSDDGVCPHAKALGSWSADPKETWEALQRPLHAEVETQVKAAVLRECKAALMALPSADELKDAAAPPIGLEEESASRVRERLAARVLLGERYALEACAGFWQRASTS